MIYPIFSNYIPHWRCTTNQSFSNNCTIFLSCKDSIQFDEIAFSSAALEYDWICGASAYWASLYSQIQFLGVLLGTIIAGTLSDIFGRQPLALISLACGIIISFFSGLAPSWKILLASRFFVGLSIGGTIVVVCTYVMEMLLPKQRMALRAFFNWGVARLMMTIICYLLPEWRLASFGNAIAALPALLIVFFVFPESPAWLHSKNRIDEMRESEKKIARVAGVPYVEIEHKMVQKNKRLIDVIRQSNYGKRLFVLWLMWFTASLCGYAIDLNSSRISGNLFINQALFSILIAASKGIAILVINLIGTVFIEYTWDACYLCAIESMPTSMRASSLGSCSFIARIGALLSPMIFFLSNIWSPSAYLTVVIVGIISLTSSCLFLVDTKDVNLDTVDNQSDTLEQEQIPMVQRKQ
uniref:Major facilitator superfamily (MFS) profile domain-containing protein n=1 Tax=Setaria digitata TaxID=48799 RepID=A0A915PUE0_9BILA